MRSCDIALPGFDDGQALTGRSDADAIVDFYLRLGARLVVLKLGKEGAIVATLRRRERIAAHPVKAIDATGAGDCFDGAFLTEYRAPQRSVRRGAFRQCGGGAVDVGLRRGRAVAAARRRRSRDGGGRSLTGALYAARLRRQP